MSEEPGGNYRAGLSGSESRNLTGAVSLLGDAIFANSGRINPKRTGSLSPL
jgi:hypothetical protein